MSFLDVLESIGTGQRPAAPQSPNQYTATTTSRPFSSSAKTDFKLINSTSNVERRPTTSNPSKRKVDDAFPASARKPAQPVGKEAVNMKLQSKTDAVSTSSQALRRNGVARVSSLAATMATTRRLPKDSPKDPPQGSFAALMAAAKASQEQKVKNEVGQIKHQATARERVSMTEKRKRLDEDRVMKAKLGGKSRSIGKGVKKVASSPKLRETLSYKGTAKPDRPVVSSYKGTAGLASRHRPSSKGLEHKAGSRPRRYDEYLGTDEEDEAEGENDDGDVRTDHDRYESDLSSDMEADAFAVEEEESMALRQAKADDARELALESKLKQEKEDRKKKLQALAKKRR